MRVSLGWASFARMSTAIPLLFALPNASHAEIDLTRLSTWGSSTMERMAGGFSSLAGENGLRFFNGGDGGAYTDSVLAVQGSMPAELSFSAPGLGTLAGSGEVAVNIPNVQTNPQANSWTGRLGATGVTGTVRYSATEGAWVFTASGGDLSVLEAGRNYSFLPDVGTEFAEGFQVLNLGKNDFFRSSTADEIVQWSIDTFAALEDAEKRVLVMGHFMNEEAPYDPAIRARILEVNQRLKDTFGDNYIDLQAYVTGAEIWEDMGITPTAEDLAAQAAGYKPPSLSADLLHLTMDASRSVVDNLVAPRFRALYTEAFADVHLTAARRHLLPALSGIAADGQGAANRMARAERAQLFTDLVHGDQRDGSASPPWQAQAAPSGPRARDAT